jgi:hypothetical protein
MRSNFTVLVARVLTKNMPFFGKFAAGMVKNIKHQYYHETSQKSEVVGPLVSLLQYFHSYKIKFGFLWEYFPNVKQSMMT